MTRYGKGGAGRLARAIRLTSLLFVGLSLSNAIGTGLFLRNARPARGVIIGMDQIDNPVPLVAPETGRVFYPVVEFADEGNTRYVIEARRGIRSPDVGPGDTVEVLYRPERPQSARLNDPVELWGATGVFGGLAALALFISLVAPFGFADIRAHRRSASPVWKEDES